MNVVFTPTEAAALVKIPAKRVYKEIEHAVITSNANPPRLPFADRSLEFLDLPVQG
ncbi:hypothetical protein [Dulcicalothrix desertica]|uniref:hypothetical protein n=1 Tax=Dulcicalothrix desertica TaxID=32056 RepID=UPI0011992F27|nr:hypothetical protein [Dulcicalothrix desertica]TWH40675.1 hypothetical protein CAL7102_10023 [Dulcicalothrix desertica PCC 7102]